MKTVRFPALVFLAVAIVACYTSESRAQCFGGQCYGGYGYQPNPFGYPGQMQWGTPGVVDSSQLSGLVSSPFQLQGSPFRFRVIGYPIQQYSYQGITPLPFGGGYGYGGGFSGSCNGGYAGAFAQNGYGSFQPTFGR